MDIEGVNKERLATLVEAELRRAPRAYRVALYGLAAVLAVGIAAGIFTRVPEIVKAPGLVRTQREQVPVDAERSARVARLLVKEGEVVAEGDLMLELEAEDIAQSVSIHRERLSRWLEQEVELDKLLDALRTGGDHELSIYAERYESVRCDLNLAAQRAAAAERELDHYEKLTSNAVATMEVERKRDEAKTARLSFEELHARHRAQVETELRTTQREILDGREAIANLEIELGRSRVVAPVAGRVAHATIREVGAVVQRGQRLFQVAPEGSGWTMEAWLPAGRHGAIHTGMEARVYLFPYPVADFGTIPGVLDWVSPDTSEASGGGPPVSAGAGARRIRIRLLEDRVRGREGVGSVAMGMAGEARLVVRERRLLFHLIGKIESAVGLHE